MTIRTDTRDAAFNSFMLQIVREIKATAQIAGDDKGKAILTEMEAAALENRREDVKMLMNQFQAYIEKKAA